MATPNMRRMLLMVCPMVMAHGLTTGVIADRAAITGLTGPTNVDITKAMHMARERGTSIVRGTDAEDMVVTDSL